MARFKEVATAWLVGSEQGNLASGWVTTVPVPSKLVTGTNLHKKRLMSECKIQRNIRSKYYNKV